MNTDNAFYNIFSFNFGVWYYHNHTVTTHHRTTSMDLASSGSTQCFLIHDQLIQSLSHTIREFSKCCIHTKTTIEIGSFNLSIPVKGIGYVFLFLSTSISQRIIPHKWLRTYTSRYGHEDLVYELEQYYLFPFQVEED